MDILIHKKAIIEKANEIYNLGALETYGRIKNHLVENKLPAHLDGIIPLYEFILERLNAVALLVENDLTWDAEIVLRSVTECMVKYLYICLSPEGEREEKKKEFWEDLEEINRIKQSKQAKRMLDLFPDNEIMQTTFKPIIVSREEEELITSKKSRKERQNLEQKWSFSELVRFLSENYGGINMPLILGLTHNYRMSSHLIHADETGISIIQERKTRTLEQQEVVNMAHFGRLYSDIVYYSIMAAIGIMEVLKEDKQFYFTLGKTFEELNKIIEWYNNRIFDLDSDYAKNS